MAKRRRTHTETSTFGVSKRESHDASRYYARALQEVKESEDVTLNELPPLLADRLICGDSTDMSVLPDNSVALMVTSPSYHVGKDYDTDSTFAEYLSVLERVLTEVERVLEPGGRCCINVANLGRRPYVPLSDFTAAMCRDIGLLADAEIIWVKGKGASGSTAWGSWMKASRPIIRDLHELILVFSKGRWGRVRKGVSTITSAEFMAYTLSIWEMRTESAKRIGHPAPFPVELPRRLIKLYTFENDVVLDPFMGAGATAVAAVETGRRFIGWDLDASYLATAEKRVAAARGRPEEKGAG